MLRLEGELDVAVAPRLEEAVTTVPPSARLIVDLSPLSFIDSTGLQALLALDARLREAGGRLECVVPPEGAVRRLFDLIGLDDSLAICEELPG